MKKKEPRPTLNLSYKLGWRVKHSSGVQGKVLEINHRNRRTTIQCDSGEKRVFLCMSLTPVV